MVAVWKPELHEDLVLMEDVGEVWGLPLDIDEDEHYVKLRNYNIMSEAFASADQDLMNAQDELYDKKQEIKELNKEIEKLEKQLEEILNQ